MLHALLKNLHSAFNTEFFLNKAQTSQSIFKFVPIYKVFANFCNISFNVGKPGINMLELFANNAKALIN